MQSKDLVSFTFLSFYVILCFVIIDDKKDSHLLPDFKCHLHAWWLTPFSLLQKFLFICHFYFQLKILDFYLACHLSRSHMLRGLLPFLRMDLRILDWLKCAIFIVFPVFIISPSHSGRCTPALCLTEQPFSSWGFILHPGQLLWGIQKGCRWYIPKFEHPL